MFICDVFFDKMCANMKSLKSTRWSVGMGADVFPDGHADKYSDRLDKSVVKLKIVIFLYTSDKSLPRLGLLLSFSTKCHFTERKQQ